MPCAGMPCRQPAGEWASQFSFLSMPRACAPPLPQMAAVTGGLDGSPVVLIQGPPGAHRAAQHYMRVHAGWQRWCTARPRRLRGRHQLPCPCRQGTHREWTLVRPSHGTAQRCSRSPAARPPPALPLPGTGKTKTILGLLSIIMHSAPRGAFASAAANGGSGGEPTSPTSAAAGQPSYVRYRQMSADKRRRVWMEANPHLLGRPDPRWAPAGGGRCSGGLAKVQGSWGAGWPASVQAEPTPLQAPLFRTRPPGSTAPFARPGLACLPPAGTRWCRQIRRTRATRLACCAAASRAASAGARGPRPACWCARGWEAWRERGEEGRQPAAVLHRCCHRWLEGGGSCHALLPLPCCCPLRPPQPPTGPPRFPPPRRSAPPPTPRWTRLCCASSQWG